VTGATDAQSVRPNLKGHYGNGGFIMNNIFHLNAETLPGFIKKAKETILNPKTLYKWDDIINGVSVKRQNGTTQTMWAVASNTFRGFHRIQKDCPGASVVFHNYFVSNKHWLLTEILSAKNSTELHNVENKICTDIHPKLSNIRQSSLDSYGRIRKPVDLYFQNLICMSQEVDRSRINLVPYLFLALDSQMFSDPNIFTVEELKNFHLSRRSTYKDVTDERTYIQLQDILSRKATQLSKSDTKFYRIYFDMLWNNRHQNWGSNFFETNP
jgi:hypothetical protein